MKGCRALKDEEILMVNNTLSNTRDRVLFMLGVSTGFRISELLSIKVKDVYQNKHALNRVSVSKQNTKGKIEGRSVAIGKRVQDAIGQLVVEECLTTEMPLFYSRKGGAIGRKHAWRILKIAYKLSGLTGALGSHSMRKTLARKIYEASGKDLTKTQKALGHKSMNSTVSYLNTTQEEVDDLVTSIDLFKTA